MSEVGSSDLWRSSPLCTDLAVRVDIDALIIIAQQELHPVSVRQSDDGVRSDGALGMFGHVDVIHAEIISE